MAIRAFAARTALASRLRNIQSSRSMLLTQQSRGLQTAPLPDLPYDYGALEPAISGEIMQIHHQKHHQAYITNYNKALDQLDSAIAKGETASVVKLHSAINFNGGDFFLHATTMMDSHDLKSVMDLPAFFRSTFSFRYFNSLQSECFAACFHSDINMVISALTGSGKTVLFELCILRLLSRFLSRDGQFNHIKWTLKITCRFKGYRGATVEAIRLRDPDQKE